MSCVQILARLMCRFVRELATLAWLALLACIRACSKGMGTMRNHAATHDSRLSWGIRIMGVVRQGDGCTLQSTLNLGTLLGRTPLHFCADLLLKC